MMVSSSQKILACVLLCFGLTSFARAQSGTTTGSISGKITSKNKPAAGIFVAALDAENDDGSSRRSNYHARTDDTGNYRISNLPPGTYNVYPVAVALVIEKGTGKQTVLVSQGENVSNIDFAVIQGGVITGKITGADGQPLIEEPVNIIPIDQELPDWRPDSAAVSTDDRGIYRAFGLRQGKYKVSVGRGFSMHARQVQRQIFYPSTTDPEKATILEVTESSELRSIDIVTEPALPTFKITGRVIEGESGKPRANVLIGVVRTDGNSSVSVSGAITSNKDGDFQVENVTPGKYSISAVPFETSDWRSDSFGLDVVDRDISGLEIRTKRAASVTGVVVLQNYDGDSIAETMSQFEVVFYTKASSIDARTGGGVQVRPDGTFKISNLVAGTAQLNLLPTNNLGPRKFQLVRIEQNGVPVTAGININEGEQVEGIRLIVKQVHYTGGIRGQVKLESGELPPTAVTIINLTLPPDRTPPSPFNFATSAPRADSRGRFLMEGLEPGTYDLIVTVFQPGERTSYEVARQQVTVGDSITEVTIVVKKQ